MPNLKSLEQLGWLWDWFGVEIRNIERLNDIISLACSVQLNCSLGLIAHSISRSLDCLIAWSLSWTDDNSPLKVQAKTVLKRAWKSWRSIRNHQVIVAEVSSNVNTFSLTSVFSPQFPRPCLTILIVPYVWQSLPSSSGVLLLLTTIVPTRSHPSLKNVICQLFPDQHMLMRPF